MKSTKSPSTKTKKPKSSPSTNSVQDYLMPIDVKNWIDGASSRIAYLREQVVALTEENQRLKAALRFAEQRILGKD